MAAILCLAIIGLSLGKDHPLEESWYRLPTLPTIVVAFLTGAMGITWAVAWWFLAFESPSKHPHITEHERIYIETSIGENTSILSAVSIMEVIIYGP